MIFVRTLDDNLISTMATLQLISNSISLSSQPSVHYHKSVSSSPSSSSLKLSFRSKRSSRLVYELGSMNTMRNYRCVSFVRRAGPPGTATYIFAFVFPLSLLLATIISALKVDDMIEQKFLEEVAVNKDISEAGEEEGDEEIDYLLEEKTEVSRTRNRPKRELEV